MAKLFELDDYFLISALLLFLLINFNEQIGMIYLFMVLIDIVFYYIAKDARVFQAIPLQRERGNKMFSLVIAMGAYVAFIYIVGSLSGKVMDPSSGYGSMLEYVSSLVAGAFSATPILAGSDPLKLVAWGVLIPIIETRFFFRTFTQWTMSIINQSFPHSILSMGAVILMVFVGAIFMVFHVMAKGISNNESLMTTFIFGAMSVGLVIFFRQFIEAIFLHIITNTIAVMQQLKMGFFAGSGVDYAAGVPILLGIMLVSWLIMFQEIPFIKSSSG